MITVSVMRRVLVGAVVAAGLVLSGCASAPVLTPEQVACQEWAAAFSAELMAGAKAGVSTALVDRANAAPLKAPGSPVAELMNIALVRAQVGGDTGPDLLDVQHACAAAGAPFEYKA